MMKTFFDWIESKVLSMTKVYSPLPEGRFTLGKGTQHRNDADYRKLEKSFSCANLPRQGWNRLRRRSDRSRAKRLPEIRAG